uniref:Pdc1 n=1 Tax=Arundo donax TaxID=35708 RepID=A0A0A9B1W0_ARUDO
MKQRQSFLAPVAVAIASFSSSSVRTFWVQQLPSELWMASIRAV